MRSLSILLFLIFPLVGMAEEGRMINCRFACLDRSAPPPPMLTFSGDGVEIPVSIPTSKLSAVTPCFSRNNAINFISPGDRTPLATATIPGNVKSVVLIFVASPKTATSLPWRIFVIEDTDKNLPDGGAYVANFYNQDIRFVIGENKIMLHPAASHGVSMPTKRDDFNMSPVVFQFQQGDAWKDASESMLRFMPGSRYLMFAYMDASNGRPRIITFQDFKTSTPKTSPAGTQTASP